MQECWRWFGPLDKIGLDEVAQTGAVGIVTALHDVAYGQVWSNAAIEARRNMILADTSLGLSWQVVESLPVHDDIKRGAGDLSALFANYRQSLANLAACGIRTVCYNFMPVLDWARTDHATPVRGGGTALTFSEPKMAAFEIHMLKRDGAENDYKAGVRAEGKRWFDNSTKADREGLLTNIMAGLPGAYDRYGVDELNQVLKRYEGFGAEDLRANYERFLSEIIPAADDLGMRLCVHPDDPPRPVFGLPRIVSTEEDAAWILDRHKCQANGLTFCSGAFGAHPGNDLVAMARRFCDRTHFLHLRNVTKSPDGSFTEDDHLDGDADMVTLISVFLAEEKRRRQEGRSDDELPFRPDHGHELVSDMGRGMHPGYPLVGRLRGLAELRGVLAALMPRDLENRCRKLVADLGLGTTDSVLSVRPLTGGVASDIAVVELESRRICVKFALGKLKVREDWRAPVHRNKSEYQWLEFAASIAPDNVPQLYGRSEAENGFAMEYLSNRNIYLWKDALLQDRPQRGEASGVAHLLGRIHRASATADFDRSAFDNRDDFRALRLEPYLNFTATRHPALAENLTGLARALYERQTALVHGDVSPKNILFRKEKPILLDAECATMGDPGFDVAFCLNHLVLKALHIPRSRALLLASVAGFWDAYREHVDWEDPDALQVRVSALLPALMLARVDGKSPVEYLDCETRDLVRRISCPLIAEPAGSLAGFIQHIEKETGN